MCLEEARAEREEPSGEEGGEGCPWRSDPPQGNSWEFRENGSAALCYHVQRAVCLSRQSEARRTSTHLGPPQEQPPASAGKLHGLHDTALKGHESVSSERQPFNHGVLARNAIQRLQLPVQRLSLIIDPLYCPSSHTEVYDVNV